MSKTTVLKSPMKFKSRFIGPDCPKKLVGENEFYEYLRFIHKHAEMPSEWCLFDELEGTYRLWYERSDGDGNDRVYGIQVNLLEKGKRNPTATSVRIDLYAGPNIDDYLYISQDFPITKSKFIAEAVKQFLRV
jgi:hypothetical protein